MPRPMPFPSSPVTDNLFHRKAGVSLDFLVIGGSVAGLSCAYNLRQAGHRVKVLERSQEIKSYGAVRVPPNMTKLLLHWGLNDKVSAVGYRCPKMDFLEGRTGEWLGGLVYHEALMKELQANTYGMHFNDLYEMIYDIAVESGVEITYGAEVTDVDIPQRIVSLKSGERLKGDVIIGADGVNSIVRRKLVGELEEEPIGPYTGYTFTVPVKRLLEDPELKELTKDGSWKVWMGAKRCVLSHMVRPDEYSVQIISPNPTAAKGWEHLVDLSQFDFSDFEPRCQRLLRSGTKAMETQHILQKQLEEWSDDDGNVVLVGDAVHLLNPGTQHGAALAMEDGAVFGSLFSRLRTGEREEITRLLMAFQEIRQSRCNSITDSEYQKVHFSVLEEGDPIRVARDAGFRAAADQHALDWENVDEEYLRASWEELKGSFGYEAYDAADDWWVDWGVLRERMSAAMSIANGIAIPVSSEDEGDTDADEKASTGTVQRISTENSRQPTPRAAAH